MGGFGKRLMPIKKNSKAYDKINGKPMLERLIGNIKYNLKIFIYQLTT